MNQKEIALEVGVHPFTISREFKRNNDALRGYNTEFAQVQSVKVERAKAKRFSLTKPIEKYIRSKLKQDWSPEQISGRMKLDTGVYVRKSKFTIIKNVPIKEASVVTKALIEMIYPIKGILKTITSDNGKEFAYHKQVSAALDTNFYFANPYHSWERTLTLLSVLHIQLAI